MTKFKALSMIQARNCVRERYGEHGVALVQAAMSDAGRAAIYSDELVATDWIEFDHCVEHTVAIDRVFGTGDGTTVTAIMRDLTQLHYSGLYRAMLDTTPRGVLENTSRLWNRFYDQGQSQVEFHGPTHATKRILNCPDLPLHHDWILVPYFEVLLQLCGAREAKARHVKCVARGAECCETEIRWKEPLPARQPPPSTAR